jgi:hypothetical protein
VTYSVDTRGVVHDVRRDPWMPAGPSRVIHSTLWHRCIWCGRGIRRDARCVWYSGERAAAHVSCHEEATS